MVFLDFRTVIAQWTGIGVFDVLLPLLLVFALIYAILEKSKILGGYRSIDAVVSLIISLFVIANRHVTELFVPIFSKAGLAIIILVAVLIIVGLMTGEEPSKNLKTIGAIGGIGLFIWLLMAMSDYYPGYFQWSFFSQYWWMGNANWFIPLMLGIIFIIVIIATTGKKGGHKEMPAEVKK